MEYTRKTIATALIGLFLTTPVAFAGNIETGKQLAFDRKKGNCLACHKIEGGEQTGTIGPPLVMMKLRYPDHKLLWKKIYDSTADNPNSVMPPFGRHGIFTDDELESIVDFIETL